MLVYVSIRIHLRTRHENRDFITVAEIFDKLNYTLQANCLDLKNTALLYATHNRRRSNFSEDARF